MKRVGGKNIVPFKLGITGGIGSGKSYVCNNLQKKGINVLSADAMARNAVLPGTSAYQQILSYFGNDILSADKTLNRNKLRRIITQDKEKKEMLEQIVHPEVFLQMDREFEKAAKRHDPVIAFEIPLLFETRMEGYFDYVLTVCVTPKERIKRIMTRDRVTEQQAVSMMSIQMPDEEKVEKSDFVIDNSGTFAETDYLIDRFYENFTNTLKID